MTLTSASCVRVFLITLLTPRLASAEEVGTLFQQVRPVLTGKCLSCHGPDKKTGGLDLSRREQGLAGGDTGPALVPGKATESLVYRKLAAGEMPPANALSPEQLQAFARWIDAGAPYPVQPLTAPVQRAGADWWSLRKVAHP